MGLEGHAEDGPAELLVELVRDVVLREDQHSALVGADHGHLVHCQGEEERRGEDRHEGKEEEKEMKEGREGEGSAPESGRRLSYPKKFVADIMAHSVFLRYTVTTPAVNKYCACIDALGNRRERERQWG